jgi:2-polyprenyl-3-methyl-5-hydroxy-6-metoxy-1,4-benzoquinol methylase
MGYNKTWISIGDFIDLGYKLRQKGIAILGSLLNPSGQARTASKWNEHLTSADFWILPEVRKRWNEDCTGDPDLEYETYVMQRYLADKSGLRMLSVGCGTGARERKWARYPQFDQIEGMDVAGEQVEKAKAEAEAEGLQQIQYFTADFRQHHFSTGQYDVILFNSSLHHFADIDELLEHHVMPLLTADGVVIVFEYAGPNRLQWTDQQLAVANALLSAIPEKYRVRFQARSIKKKVYRPGEWRVRLIDPSEAVDSENLVPALHRHFDIVEEQRVRYDIAHLVLKDIAHHFLREDAEAKKWLQFVFDGEDAYCEETGNRDAVFDIYKKRSNNPSEIV